MNLIRHLTIRLKDRRTQKLKMKRRHDAFKEAISAAEARAAGIASAMTFGGSPLTHADDTVGNRASTGPDAINVEEDTLWALILGVFPDICPSYVEKIYREQRKSLGRFPDDETLINAILEAGPYPTVEDRKRRKVDEVEKIEPKLPKWNVNDGVRRNKQYYNSARALLRADYPHIPVFFLKAALEQHGTLYSAYSYLWHLDSNYNESSPYERLPNMKSEDFKMPPIETLRIAKAHQENLSLELLDARNARLHREEQKRKAEEIAKLEAENEEIHLATGGLMECKCCYVDVPLNRMAACEGNEAHFFCADCIKMNAETQIGYMRYEIHCMDTSDCKAPFSPTALAEILGKTLKEKLDELRQRDEIEKAGIDGLEECPFCDFKAIYPPIEENREFRCMKSDCAKVSCRACKLESHIPKSCDEVRKERHMPMRHKIEEAMSQAIIRNCPNSKCKMPIIKEDGCNKMYCTKCRSVMCYICKQDITKDGYNHFTVKQGACPLHDLGRADRRHYEEVARAQITATKEALKSNPELKPTDIEVELPEKNFDDCSLQVPPVILGQAYNPQLGPFFGGAGVPGVPINPNGLANPAGNWYYPPHLPGLPHNGQLFPGVGQFPAHDPFNRLLAWNTGPRRAPAIQADIQPQVNNINNDLAMAGAQLRQRFFEEQRFQRIPTTGPIPAVRPAMVGVPVGGTPAAANENLKPIENLAQRTPGVFGFPANPYLFRGANIGVNLPVNLRGRFNIS
ncbi:RBR-type E3 ubiquitin transferase [Emydomyces testavorans]|uniref:RBR-type E3 ubiquitin transferase n=1 Tax=Emydomyces testavorans TaxID=2070801 RepID=A0AAF0DF73_9EURO|nr:RBR-type E3 ubiquitin transferase [Emydomyces testavorans]